MSDSLTANTVHGLKWTYASTVVTGVLQIGVTAVLARLVAPRAFGTVAMAGVFLSFGQYFAQLGIGQAVVQRRVLTDHDMRTAFASSLILGFGFCALFVVLAPLSAVLFPHTRGVVAIARVMAFTFVLSGLTAPTRGLLQRRMAFRLIALTEIISFVAGYALIGVTLASVGFGAWSLVIAALAQGAIAAAAYTALCRSDIGFGLGARSLRSLYSFGGRVSLIGFCEFVGSNLDTIWAGRYLGSLATGFYTRATNLATVPLYYFVTSLSRVLLPGYSRIQTERERLKATYLVTMTVFGAIIVPVSWGVAAASREIVATLLGPRWAPAAPVLAILALGAPISLLTHFGVILCEATASLNVKIVVTVGRIAVLAGLLFALARFGITGIAGAYALSELVTHFAYLHVMRRLLAVKVGELWRAHSIGVGAGVITGFALLGVHLVLAPMLWPPLLVLALQVILGAGCLAATVTRARHGTVWREIRWRLVEAGYKPDGGSRVSWLMRRLDSLAPCESVLQAELPPSDGTEAGQ